MVLVQWNHLVWAEISTRTEEQLDPEALRAVDWYTAHTVGLGLHGLGFRLYLGFRVSVSQQGVQLQGSCQVHENVQTSCGLDRPAMTVYLTLSSASAFAVIAG